MPPELLHEVCENLPRKDLPSYRLVNKVFADVGAAGLFKRIIFHASFASFFRVSHLAAHPQLHKYLQELVWDTNVWEMDVIVPDYDAFRARVKHKVYAYHSLGMHASDPGSRYTPVEHFTASHQAKLESQVQQAYILYQQRKAEESVVLKDHLTGDRFSAVIRQFPSLREVKILNGAITTWTEPDEVCSSTPLWPDWSSEVPDRMSDEVIARGEGCWEVNLKTGLPAHHAFQQSLLAFGDQLKTLDICHLSYKSFASDLNVARVARHCPNITTLKLVVLVRVGRDNVAEDHTEDCRVLMKNGVLKEFLAALHKLNDLTLWVTHKSREYVQAVDLADVIPSDRTGLREIYFNRFETSEEHLMKLLRTNATTLRCLALTDVFLNPQGSWEKIFRLVRQRLNLTHAHFNGHLCDSVRIDAESDQYSHCTGMEDGWDFNWYSDDEDDEGGVELCRKLRAHLVDGEPSPLSRKTKTAFLMKRKDLISG